MNESMGFLAALPCAVLTLNHFPGLQSLCHLLAGCLLGHFQAQGKRLHPVFGGILSSIPHSLYSLDRLSQVLSPGGGGWGGIP